MRLFTYLILLVALLLGITFACLNAEPVLINYYVGKHSLPLSLLLAITFAVGCFLGLFVGIIPYIKQKAKNYHLSSRVKLAEKELSNLRTIPLRDNR